MAEAVVEARRRAPRPPPSSARRVAVALVEVADRAVEVAAVDAGADGAAGELERLPRVRVPLAISAPGVPTANVRVMSEKQALSRSCGKRSKTTWSSFAIRPEPVSWPTAACGAVRDDEVVAAAAVLGEHAPSQLREALARERLAVDHAPAVARLRPREQLGDRGHAGLGRALRAPDPRRAPARSSRAGGRRRSAGRPSSMPARGGRPHAGAGTSPGTRALRSPSELDRSAR